MIKVIFDIEADGLLNDITKIYCVSYVVVGEWKLISITTPEEIKAFFNAGYTYIGHNIKDYDLVAIKRIYGIDTDNVSYMDTLFVSWYVFPKLKKYGLDDFGKLFGIEKVKIANDAWKNLSTELATERCEGDVKINSKLYVNIISRLKALYSTEEEIDHVIRYLTFKSDCAFEQANNPIKLDIVKAQTLLNEWEIILEEKRQALAAAMPKVPKFAVKKKPAQMYLKNGELSIRGKDWFEFLDKYGISRDNEKPVRYPAKWEEPNANSPEQIKEWLFSLGWVPATYKFDRNKETGEVKQIPQILTESKDICHSIVDLIEKEPKVELLRGFGVLKHRYGQVKGLLENVDRDGFLTQRIVGLTSTLRMKHGVVVNLPGVDKPYGKDIRGLFMADEGTVVFGVDIKNLESRTKDHYITPYDPEYVEQMNDPSFDSHLDISQLAGYLTVTQVQEHKDKVADYSKERKKGKVVNFSAQYGVGAKTLARNSKMPIEEAQRLLDVYWKRNWSILEAAKSFPVKEAFGFKWVYNPVSKLWMLLRAEKDVFSAVNQSTGVFVFDTFLMYCRALGLVVRMQMHDELLCYSAAAPESVEKTKATFLKAIEMTNKRLQLNVKIDIDVKYGENYSDVH